MKVFAVSDVHVDYQVNENWLLGLSSTDYQDDVLILAGDLTDDATLLERCLIRLTRKFRKVMFIPGNHELWVIRDKETSSLDKLKKVLRISADCGVSTNIQRFGELTIVPLFSWYDFSFGEPGSKLNETWSDFRACSWPPEYDEASVTKLFLNMNAGRLETSNRVLISFSHFLPRIDLMPFYIPASFRYLYPVLGSTRLGDQVDALQPDIHVYGHSHVNRQVRIGRTKYINNAFGYPSEKRIANKELLCIYGQN